jgi:hypothetical protein
VLQSVLTPGFRAIVVALGAGHLGCGDEPPPTSRSATVTAAATNAAAAPPSGSAAAAASAKEAPASKLAGRWSGTYESKKARVSLEKGVKDKALESDDGTAASGKGEIELVVAADGTVTGRVSGPLGPGMLSGWAEADGITATLAPEDAGADGAMSGTLALEPAQSEWKGTLRASSGSGEIAREAEVTVKPASK